MLPRATAVCIILFSVAQLAAASFVFEFQLSLISTRGNCFGDDLSLACETYLSTFCLRRSTETSGCSLGSSGRHGPGGSLPITRQISSSNSWPESFQMYIKARDEDNPGTDDDLDDIFINESREPNTGFSPTREYLGNNNKVSIQLRYHIYCQDNFYGTDCSTFCLAQDDDVNGHYTCNNDGSIRCRDGFENPSNNCRERITACSSSPCEQDAPCMPIGLSDYSCLCPAGFTGKSCEIDINECDPNPCQNNGNCTDLIADYSCQCSAGFAGKSCNINIDDCAGIECRGNSTCIDGVDSYQCVCNLGFEGENCTEINPCESIPCANSGNCIPMGPFNYTCQCVPGYTGLACEAEIDECLTAVCPANSVCVDSVNSYSCVCLPGFEGEECTRLEQPTNYPMTEESAQRSVMSTIIAGAVTGVLIVILLIIILIVIAFLLLIRKARNKEETHSLPNELATSSNFTRADSHIYETGEDVKGGDIAPNPLYHTPEPHEGSVSSPMGGDPYYSYVSTTTSPDHSSTLRLVNNPVYGTQSPPHNSDGIYSLPQPLTSAKTNGTAGTAEEYPYAYARVETGRMSLKGNSGSVIRTEQQASHAPPTSYEYITMASAQAAKPELNEPTVSLSAANGGTNVAFKRSIYDDNFQYEEVNITRSAAVHASEPILESHPDPQNSTGSPAQSSHYDVPRSYTETTPMLTRPEESDGNVTSMYGNVSDQHQHYNKLNHGTELAQSSNFVRLGKIEGSGYEILNKN